jgi:hypothetical protein
LTSAPTAPKIDPKEFYGLGNQLLDPFSDPRLPMLGLHKMRIILPWDVVPRASNAQVYVLPNGTWVRAAKDPNKLATIDRWMQFAHDQGYEVLVSFERSVASLKGTGQEKYLPSVGEYQWATDMFRDRYRALGQTVPLFTAWNEPNHPSQPTSGHYFPQQEPATVGAKRAGQFWRNLKKRCIGECTVIAGDFSDRQELTKAYLDAYRQGAGYDPPTWAYHPYYAGYNGTGTKPWVARFDKFRKATAKISGKNSRIWLTELGPLYHLPKVNYCEDIGDDHLKRLLALAQRSSRVARFYYYGWQGGYKNPPGGFGGPQWDSSLTDVNHINAQNLPTLRKAFFTYKAVTNPTEPTQFTRSLPPCSPSTYP